MRPYKSIFLLLVTLIATSCGWQDNKVCTKEEALVTVEIVDQNDNPIELDSTQTKMPNGEILLVQRAYFDYFTVVTDGELTKISKKGIKLTFLGWKDAVQLFTEEFTVGRDDCHIRLLDGPRTIVL